MTNRAVMPMIRVQGAPRIMIGVSTTTVKGQSLDQNMAETESFAGHQSIHRDYTGTDYDNFDTASRQMDYDKNTQTTIRTTHISWNPDAGKLDAGDSTELAKLEAWLDTIPTWHKVILNPYHEPEYNTGSFSSDYALFRRAFRIIANAVHARNNPRWQVCLLLIAYTFKGDSSGAQFNPDSYWPGLDSNGKPYVDVMGIDIYNEGSLDGRRWDSPGSALGYPANAAEVSAMNSAYGGYKTTNGFLGWCENKGITKWVIGEVGTQINKKNVHPSWVDDLGISNSKADWIREIGRFVNAYNLDPSHNAKCIGIEYFVSAGRNYDGTGYLTNAIHWRSDLSLVTGVVGTCNNTVDLPSNYGAGDIGKRYFVESPRFIREWDGTTWNNIGNGIWESWQLWWNNADYAAWGDVTSAYGLSVG
ncbi:MAG: hypothetical protein ACOH18_04545 [Candidatus Saccharimonadaceae bacterium]